MLETIERLLVLQDRDRRLRRIQGELAHIEPERRLLHESVTAAQAALENAKTRGKQLESNRKDLELEVEAKSQLIARYSNQQLQTRKNEEYRALAHEIEMCKAEILKLEDRQLELMEQAEAAQKEAAQAAQLAGNTRKLVDEQLAALATRQQNLQQELAQLSANRDDLAAAVEALVRARYERLVRSKGENVVVGVQHGVCGGCHMRLPPQVLVMCQADKEVISCSNCGRILYYTPDMDLLMVD